MRKEKSMAKTNAATRRDDETLRNGDVPDQTVAQVGKAVAQILKLRQSLEEHMATARTEEERQSLAEEVESAAVQAIDDNGLTVTQYNQVIAAAQADSELEERVLTACRTA
jgi:hypothetical protein